MIIKNEHFIVWFLKWSYLFMWYQNPWWAWRAWFPNGTEDSCSMGCWEDSRDSSPCERQLQIQGNGTYPRCPLSLSSLWLPMLLTVWLWQGIVCQHLYLMYILHYHWLLVFLTGDPLWYFSWLFMLGPTPTVVKWQSMEGTLWDMAAVVF